MRVKIDKGVPMPVSRTTGEKLPFDEMKVGDSFAVPDRYKNPYATTQYGNRTFKPKRFACRKLEGVFRIWRVE